MKRQIAKLEAEVARKTREEMSGAIAKVREIMTTFGLTVEHLTSGGHAGAKKVPTKKSAAKKVKGKRAGAGTPKYRDPKSAATWTGFGRAPGWIASAKSRDAFLIDKPVSEAASAAASAAPAKAAATKKVAKKAAVKATKAAKNVGATASKKSAAASAKAVAEVPAVAVKKGPAKKAAGKKIASKKAAAKKSPTKAVASKKAKAKSVPVAAEAAPATAAA
jgi:DNA-binding protein H-NS